MSKTNNNKLTEIEWDTCWTSIRYAMNSSTYISSICHDLVRAYYNRWTDNQKRAIANDLQRNEADVKHWSDGKSLAFGHKEIDRPHWLKFWAACDIHKHYEVTLSTGQKVVAFLVNERFYPLKEYIAEPHREIFVDGDGIKSEERIVKSSDIEEKAAELFNSLLPKMNQTNEPRIVQVCETHSIYIHFQAETANWTYTLCRIEKP